MLTETHRENLTKLADYLESLPYDYSHFNMSMYSNMSKADELRYGKENGGLDKYESSVAWSGCGTAACALGHGPAAGVLIRDEDTSPFLNWNIYARRFVPPTLTYWSWVFDGVWSVRDGHHYGAAARIRYLLHHGAPPNDYSSPGFARATVGSSRKDWSEVYASFRKVPEEVSASGAVLDK
jgi:hypothetical protein